MTMVTNPRDNVASAEDDQKKDDEVAKVTGTDPDNKVRTPLVEL